MVGRKTSEAAVKAPHFPYHVKFNIYRPPFKVRWDIDGGVSRYKMLHFVIPFRCWILEPPPENDHKWLFIGPCYKTPDVSIFGTTEEDSNAIQMR